jgi:hypothetical protein
MDSMRAPECLVTIVDQCSRPGNQAIAGEAVP